jgi:hypothetical protein
MVQYHGKYESGEWTEDEISRHPDRMDGCLPPARAKSRPHDD